MKRVILLVSALLIAYSAPVNAQNHNTKLFVANYGVSFGQQFVGKVVRGENILESFVGTLYEAIPSATLQYAGMKMVGGNQRLALPAQLLVQKGAQVQRRSILGRSVFSRELFTSWELDYLWFNVRIDDGKVLLPRVNVATVLHTFRYRDISDFNLEKSLLTGSVVNFYTKDSPPPQHTSADSIPSWGFHNSNVVWIVNASDDKLFSHEFVHALQHVRGNVLSDVLFRQDASQKRPLSFFRVDMGTAIYQSFGSFHQWWVGAVKHRSLLLRSRFDEWEAYRYAGYIFPR